MAATRFSKATGNAVGKEQPMRTVEQLRSDFALYTGEMQRCEDAKCYWALLHLLFASRRLRVP